MANRPIGYGMTAELKQKQDAKHDPFMEQQAREWLEAIVGEPFPEGSFQEALKDGVYLCKVINTINPGSIAKVNPSKMAFKMMENIGFFLTACEKFGLTKQDLFQTVDLYEGQNIPQVINGIHALGRKVNTQRPDLPGLGPKESTEQKREFSQEQLEEGKKIIGLQMGSNRGASQAGMSPYGLSRQVEKTNLKN